MLLSFHFGVRVCTGNDAIKRKHYPEAVEHYSEALLYEPSGPAAALHLKNRAQAYLSMRAFDLCLADCMRALAEALPTEPRDSKLCYRAGEACFGLKLYERALPFYAQALTTAEPQHREMIQKKIDETSALNQAMSDVERAERLGVVLANRDSMIQAHLEKAEGAAQNGLFTTTSARYLTTALALIEIDLHNPMLEAEIYGALAMYYFGAQRLALAGELFAKQLGVLDTHPLPETYEQYVDQVAHGSKPLSMESFVARVGQVRSMRQVAYHYLALLLVQDGRKKEAASLLCQSIESAVEAREHHKLYSASILYALASEQLEAAAVPDSPSAAGRTPEPAVGEADLAFWKAQMDYLRVVPGVDLATLAENHRRQQAAMTGAMMASND